MKQVTLRIKEGKFRFFMELLSAFDFVEVAETGDTPADIKANVQQGLREVELMEAGTLKGRPGQQLLDEL